MPNKEKTSNEYGNPAVRRIGEKLFLKNDFADVYFVLTFDDDSFERIPAHKCQLAAVSDVFEAMFYGPMKETGDVKLTDITVPAFKEFLQFFYLDQVNLTVENFAMVMKFGQMYNVIECLKVGLDFLKDTLTDEDVCSVYELALHLDFEELKQMCAKRIALNTETVFKSAGFLMCEPEVLKHILELNLLSCTETDVFKACLSWTKAASQQDEVTKQTIQEHLGELFYAIRFRSMSLEEFTDLVPSFGHLFTGDEYSEIIQMIRYKEFKSKIFNGKQRQAEWNVNAIIKCDRLSEEILMYIKIGNIEKIQFSTNKPILLGEFTCYGLKVFRDNDNGKSIHDLKTNLPVEVTIIEDISTLSENSPKIFSTVRSSLKSLIENVIILPKPLLIKPGFFYKIELKQEVDRHCYKSNSLKKYVAMDEDINIHFYNDLVYPKTNKIVGFINLLKFNQIH